MYERMLNKEVAPTVMEMTAYCGKTAELFSLLNEWISRNYGTEQKIVFPYGNKYGWGIAHRKKGKLICNIFAERDSFTVMIRLSNGQFAAVYDQVRENTQECIDHRYPCGDGGWIHYRVICPENFEDIQKILTVRLS